MLSTKTRARLSAALLGLALLALPAAVVGSQVSQLVQFSSGETINASDFNLNFGQLKDAINDTDSKVTALQARVAAMPAGPMGPQGPGGAQGPAGPTLTLPVAQSNTPPPGGGVNSWTPGTGLAGAQSFFQNGRMVGKPYTAVIKFQTADPTAGGDTTGSALVPGNLVIDFVWTYEAGGGLLATVTQPAVATLAIGATPVNTTLTVSGTVPAAPKTAGGFDTSLCGFTGATVNASTTAQGQSICIVSVSVGP